MIKLIFYHTDDLNQNYPLQLCDFALLQHLEHVEYWEPKYFGLGHRPSQHLITVMSLVPVGVALYLPGLFLSVYYSCAITETDSGLGNTRDTFD